MNAAFYAILTFTLGTVVGYYVTKRTVGERMWRAGYLYGFNHAWDEKEKLAETMRQKQLKELRKRKPRLTIVKGEK